MKSCFGSPSDTNWFHTTMPRGYGRNWSAYAAWLWVRTCAEPQCDCRSVFVVVTEAGREALLQQGAAVPGKLDASRTQWQLGSSSACSGKSNHQIKFGRSGSGVISGLSQASKHSSRKLKPLNGVRNSPNSSHVYSRPSITTVGPASLSSILPL